MSLPGVLVDKLFFIFNLFPLQSNLQLKIDPLLSFQVVNCVYDMTLEEKIWIKF